MGSRILRSAALIWGSEREVGIRVKLRVVRTRLGRRRIGLWNHV